MSDGSLGMRKEGIKRPDISKVKTLERLKYDPSSNGDEPFMRYKITDNWISPMSIPGMEGGAYVATGIEHGETGAPKYTPDNHELMGKKRFEKIKNVEDDLPESKRIGDEQADIGLIAWGSTQGDVTEAVNRARAEGLKVAALFPKLVYPVPVNAIEKFNKTVKKIMVPEINYQGQFADLIKAATGIPVIKYNIYGGFPFTPNEIHNKIKEMI